MKIIETWRNCDPPRLGPFLRWVTWRIACGLDRFGRRLACVIDSFGRRVGCGSLRVMAHWAYGFCWDLPDWVRLRIPEREWNADY